MKSSLLAAPLVLLAHALPSIHPEPALSDSEVRRSFDRRSSQELVEFTVTMGGMEVPPEYLPEMELAWTRAAHLVVLDRRSEGALVRSFEELGLDATQDFQMAPSTDEQDEGHATSPFEGRTVRFDSEGGVAWVGDGGDEDLLAGLERSLALSALVPGGLAAHHTGDSWEVDAEDLHALFYPGGNLAWEWSATEGLRAPDNDPVFPTGALTITLASVDGGQASLRLEGTLEARTESATDLSEVPVVDGTATEVRTTTFELEGRAIFDAERNEIAELRLDAELATAIETTKDEGQPGPAYSSHMGFEGTWRLTVRAEHP